MVDRMDTDDMTGLPPLSLLDQAASSQKVAQTDLAEACHQIEMVLSDLGIPAQLVSAVSGPVVAWYEIELAEGMEPVKVTLHARDFARALSVMAFRVIENITDRRRLAFEVPNAVRERIYLSDVLTAEAVQNKRFVLPVALGKTMTGVPVVVDLAMMSHLLIGSDADAENINFLHAVVLSLLYRQTPVQLRVLLVDVRNQAFSGCQAVSHLLAPVITDRQAAIHALTDAIAEMARRLQLFEKTGVTGFAEYHQHLTDGRISGQTLPRIVIIIQSYPDLFSNGREVELLLARLAMRGHIAGLHLVLATGQVSLDTVTDLIKLNVPTRIAFKVRSMTDSRRMVGQNGAEVLLGQGDMLYLSNEGETVQRIHGVTVSEEERSRVMAYFGQQGRPDADSPVTGTADL